MDIDFTNIAYLKTGNLRQQKAYRLLSELSIFEDLHAYQPILTGTIPIEIDLPNSDLDIICSCSNPEAFSRHITDLYSDRTNFRIRTKNWNGLPSTIASFQTEDFEIEIFGQDCPTESQNAYKHMLIEYQILQAKGEAFMAEIIRQKQEGLKTEPAFAKLLGLEGDPYVKLLQVKI